MHPLLYMAVGIMKFENRTEAHVGKLHNTDISLARLEKNARFSIETNNSIITELKKKTKTKTNGNFKSVSVTC